MHQDERRRNRPRKCRERGNHQRRSGNRQTAGLSPRHGLGFLAAKKGSSSLATDAEVETQRFFTTVDISIWETLRLEDITNSGIRQL